jgi:hypothetical protein
MICCGFSSNGGDRKELTLVLETVGQYAMATDKTFQLAFIQPERDIRRMLGR